MILTCSDFMQSKKKNTDQNSEILQIEEGQEVHKN